MKACGYPDLLKVGSVCDAQSTRAVTDAADEEEATPQAAMPAADEPAESSLPDDAYIRSR